MRFWYYIKRLREIPYIEIKLFLKGYVLSLLFLPVISLLPLKRYTGLLKIRPGSLVSDECRETRIRLARKTMRRITRFSLFKLSCLVRSVVFKILLAGLGVESSIVLGVNTSRPRLMQAHAFVKVEDRVVYLGKPDFVGVYEV